MDMDSYVNVPEITCDAICQYVRAKKSVSSASMKTLYKLVDGKIEVSEFVAGDDTKFLGKQLNTIKMKNNDNDRDIKYLLLSVYFFSNAKAVKKIQLAISNG